MIEEKKGMPLKNRKGEITKVNWIKGKDPVSTGNYLVLLKDGRFDIDYWLSLDGPWGTVDGSWQHYGHRVVGWSRG